MFFVPNCVGLARCVCNRETCSVQVGSSGGHSSIFTVRLRRLQPLKGSTSAQESNRLMDAVADFFLSLIEDAPCPCENARTFIMRCKMSRQESEQKDDQLFMIPSAISDFCIQLSVH